MLQRVKDGLSFSGRKVELTGAVLGNVDADDPGNLVAARLGGDWNMVSAGHADEETNITDKASTSSQHLRTHALLQCGTR